MRQMNRCFFLVTAALLPALIGCEVPALKAGVQLSTGGADPKLDGTDQRLEPDRLNQAPSRVPYQEQPTETNVVLHRLQVT